MENRLQKIIDLIDTKYSEHLDRPINFPNADLYLIIQNINPKSRLYIFKEISSLLTDEDYCFGLRTAYTKTSGLNNEDAKITLDEILDLFKNANLKVLMDLDYEVFNNLPEIVTIYRGTSQGNSKKAISWTIDKDRAIWFYKKYDSKGTVLEAKVNKKDIICYLDQNACGEKEAVVDFKKIYDVKEISKEEMDKELDFKQFQNGNVNTDYVVEATQWFLQTLAKTGFIPTMELATEVFKVYQSAGKYKSNYVIHFPSGEKIKLYDILEQVGSKSN